MTTAMSQRQHYAKCEKTSNPPKDETLKEALNTKGTTEEPTAKSYMLIHMLQQTIEFPVQVFDDAFQIYETKQFQFISLYSRCLCTFDPKRLCQTRLCARLQTRFS